MITVEEVWKAFREIDGHLDDLPSYEFACRDGWLPLLGLLARKIAALPQEDRENFRILQVKQKWGSLRFYFSVGKTQEQFSEISIAAPDGILSTRMDTGSESVSSLVRAAELASYFICEDCGEPGRLGTDRHYVSTLCEMHSIEAKQKERRKTGPAVGGRTIEIIPLALKMLSELWGREVSQADLGLIFEDARA